MTQIWMYKKEALSNITIIIISMTLIWMLDDKAFFEIAKRNFHRPDNNAVKKVKSVLMPSSYLTRERLKTDKLDEFCCKGSCHKKLAST